jgi:predicted nucleic acid-binding protein
MILVDTSVVIDFSRTGDPKLARLFALHDAAVCGVARAEVLHGARDPAHRGRLLTMLASFRHVPIADDIWDAVGDHSAELRRNGVTLPFGDVILLTVAIREGVEFWTRDAQFGHARRVLPALQLFTEPP